MGAEEKGKTTEDEKDRSFRPLQLSISLLKNLLVAHSLVPILLSNLSSHEAPLSSF